MLIAQSQHDWATVVRHGYLLLAELTESASIPVMGLGGDSDIRYHSVLRFSLAIVVSVMITVGPAAA